MTKKKKRKKAKYVVYVDRDFKTRYIQDKKTGRMEGRRGVKGFGDRTAVKRIRKNGPRGGEIVGRTKTIRVRATKRKKGTIRRRL